MFLLNNQLPLYILCSCFISEGPHKERDGPFRGAVREGRAELRGPQRMGKPQQGVGPFLRSQAVWAGGQTGPSAARTRMKLLPKLQPAGREQEESNSQPLSIGPPFRCCLYWPNSTRGQGPRRCPYRSAPRGPSPWRGNPWQGRLTSTWL